MAILIVLEVVTTSAVSLDEFYRYGLPDERLEPGDDDSSLEIHLDPPFKFYGRNYSTCQVSRLSSLGAMLMP